MTKSAATGRAMKPIKKSSQPYPNIQNGNIEKTIHRIRSDYACSLEHIEDRILIIRGQKVMLDADLSELYGVQTKALFEN